MPSGLTNVLRRASGDSLLLSALFLAAATACAQKPPDGGIRAILQDRVDSKRATGLVAGVLDGDAKRVIAAGVSGTDRPLDGDTVFEIGSITKVFTASLLADMVRRGEVKLDDPISKYLPSNVRAPSRNGRQITLLDLATQSSGLPRLPDNLSPRDPANPYADYTVEKLYEFLSRYELPRDVGSKYEYSNLGVGLLGHLLARKAGTTYEELLTKRILAPLQMRDTAITLPPAMRKRLAAGHDESGSVVPNWDLPTFAGAGGLRSTVNDMLKFLAANLGKGDPSAVAVLADTHRVRRATEQPGLDIALAWHVLHPFGEELVWHNGGTGGYHSWIGFVAKRRSAAVVLSNSSGNIDDIGIHIVVPRFPIPGPPKARKEMIVAPEVLDTYTGEYQLGPSFSIVVTREGGALFVQATNQPKLPLFAESETDFFLQVVDAQIRFVKEGGRVASLVLHQNGQDTPGRKVR
ncbi:MAG: serine hydrolase [Acidobacteriota bacterium]|nr:serine hydrolase [Acidobacteriota bacterium]